MGHYLVPNFKNHKIYDSLKASLTSILPYTQKNKIIDPMKKGTMVMVLH